MKKLTILSMATASVLMSACANETKHAENDIKIIKPANETTTSKVEIKLSSIGNDVTIGDVINSAVGSKSTNKGNTQVEKVSNKQLTLTPEDIEKIKASIKAEIKAELMVELKNELFKSLEKKSDKQIVTNKVSSNNTPFNYKLKPKKVADNVWCFFGALEKPTKENAGNMANNCYIKTNEGYLVMDTGPSYQFAKQAYEAMQKIEPLPVKYIVNSHEHDDHWLGNDFYKKKFGTTLIGPESINVNYKDGDKTRMYNVLPPNAIEGTHIIKLDKIVKKRETLVFGGEKFDIIPMDVKAHTGDDVFIYMPERKVLFAGDLVMNGRITSNRHGSVMGQLKALAMMQKLDWKVLVPGHGFITDATAMDEANLYFKLTKERVLKAIEEGVDATEINEVVKLIEFKDKAMYDILNAQNIGYAFDELEMLDEDE